MSELTYKDYPFLKELDLNEDNLGVYYGQWVGSGPVITSYNPTTGKPIARIKGGSMEDYEMCLKKMSDAKKEWQSTPPPKRGEIIRQIGDELRKYLKPLAQLVSLEMGKIIGEGYGEVQEFIDMCDYATGLSRTFEGKILPSERPDHLLMEVWNPLGFLGLITAFNFPIAVFGWNTALSLICGNCQVWKGASSTSLCSVASMKIVARVLERNNIPAGVATMILGSGATIGEALIKDKRLHLISFTGSTDIGRKISTTVHSRFGKTILELGGNNSAIVMNDANIDVALRAVVFSAVGTAGQRCTSLRRLILQEAIYDSFLEKLKKIYSQIRIGDPLDSNTLMGPIHTAKQIEEEYVKGLETIKKQGGKVIAGGNLLKNRPGNFVEPTLVEIRHDADIVKIELFVPIVYVIKFSTLEEAISINNEVPQGLTSTIFTSNHSSVFTWIGPHGSDCGIVNVNVGTSGAEIGVAFGGEKETGGGRESGSNSWQQYMRRVSCTMNYGNALPLAQGIQFNV